MSLNRRPVDRSRPMLEAYGTGLTTAEIQWAARGWGALRVFLKQRNQPESSFVQQSDWQTAGQIWLSGLTEGGLYDVRFVNQAGRSWDLKLHLPRRTTQPGVTTYKVWAPTAGPDGTIYAMTQPDSGQMGVRKTPDGGHAWSDVYLHGGPSRLYYYNGRVYASSYNSWAASVKNRLVSTSASSGGAWVTHLEMWAYDPANFPVEIYPWAFEPRGPRFIVGAGGQYNTGTWTSENANNRLYYSVDGGTNWTSVNFIPDGQTYSRHVHVVCWNPVSRCYLITIGDHIKHNYLVSEDLQRWQLVSSGVGGETGISGGTISCVDLPDGGFLTGSDDPSWGQIVRVSSDGTCTAVLRLPQYYGGEVWSIWAYPDGEVWATVVYHPDTSRVNVIYVSQDWGRTWRTVWRAPATVLRVGNIAGCYDTRRLHGDNVLITQADSLGYAAHVWRRIG